MLLEVFVLIDEDGCYVASHDSDALAELYDDNIGADASRPRRIVQINLEWTVPQPIVLKGLVPAEPTGDVAMEVVTPVE